MKKIRYIYWQDEEMWLGYLEEYPDYMTQGETIEELEENLMVLTDSVAYREGREEREGSEGERGFRG